MLASSDYEGTVTLWDAFAGTHTRLFQVSVSYTKSPHHTNERIIYSTDMQDFYADCFNIFIQICYRRSYVLMSKAKFFSMSIHV